MPVMRLTPAVLCEIHPDQRGHYKDPAGCTGFLTEGVFPLWLFTISVNLHSPLHVAFRRTPGQLSWRAINCHIRCHMRLGDIGCLMFVGE